MLGRGMELFRKDSSALFKGRHFDRAIIILCVRWYITYKLSLRDLCAMMAERNVEVAHTTILRWVQRYVPDFAKRWQGIVKLWQGVQKVALEVGELSPPQVLFLSVVGGKADAKPKTGCKSALRWEKRKRLFNNLTVPLIAYRPESVVHQISPRAILWLHGDADERVSMEESQSMYAKAGEPKKIVILPGLGHSDVISGPGLDQSLPHIKEWFETHL